MIFKNIKLFSQNVQKNKLLTNTILKSNKEFDIIFIQELPWLFIQLTSSSLSEEGESSVGVPNHSDWFTFSRQPSSDNNFPRIIFYINICLSHFQFS